MALQAHRDDDLRACGATTIVIGQSSVFVNNRLWAVAGDPCSHGGGTLISSSGKNVFVEGKRAIVVSDSATPDSSLHTDTQPISGSLNTYT